MTVGDVKHLIRECVRETLSEIESESPTGMMAVNLAEAPPAESSGVKYTELAKVADYTDPQPLQLIKMKGPSAAIDYLVSQANRYQPKQLPSPPWQSTDKTFDRGDYVLYWNETNKYVGLVKVDNGEDLQEMTGTGAVAGYMTPNAFGTKGSTGSTRALAASVGFKKVSNQKKNTAKK
jgi:hypothetical protein